MDASEQITQYIEGLDDWRGDMMAPIRKLILEADPDLTEEWKWSSPVWSKNGLVCSLGAFKTHVGINFFQGASLEDPKGLFNAGLEAKSSRNIHLNEDDTLDADAFQALVREAVEYNTSR